MKLVSIINTVFCLPLLVLPAQGADSNFLRNPSVSESQIVFNYSNQLWSMPREGGVARQLTTGAGKKTQPFISPDGKWIAYTGEYGGISNVYVIPVSGGVPKRLTFSTAGPEEVAGWTPDSRRILFRSPGSNAFWFTRLYTIGREGGLPQDLPFPEGVMGSFSPGGDRIAYVPMWAWGADRGWKHYRGGRTSRIWIARLADSSIEAIPRENSNDFDPMWLGDKVYFLSDRNGPVTLFSYDLRSRRVEELLPAKGFDIEWASAAPGVIVYEQLGTLRKLDLKNRQVSDVKAEITSDLPELQPHSLPVGNSIASFNISPTGVRAVFEARGEILTVPVDKGEIRNLTNTPGAAERDPAWSPDGRWIAYFSDESGEYALHLRSQDGADLRKINLGEPPSFFYSPQWSPDSKHISYTDARLNLWYVDINGDAPVKVDTDYYVSPYRNFDVSWSPDSRWIAYTKQLTSYMHALFFYSLDSGKATQATDGASDVRYPAFDADGKYLYFTAGVDVAQTVGWLDLSSYARPAPRNVYVILLRKDLPYPFPPESDEERVIPEPAHAEKPTAPAPVREQNAPEESAGAAARAQAGKSAETGKPASSFHIDFEDMDRRIVPLPLLARNYAGLQAGAAGMVYIIEVPYGPGMLPNNGARTVYRYEMYSRRFVKLLEGISSFQVSFDGKKAIYANRAGQHLRWSIARLPGPTPGVGDAPPLLRGDLLKTDEMGVHVKPLEEWKQIYHEAWRTKRDFFFDPKLHGLQWTQLEKQYAPYLEALSCREDLNYLLMEIFGQLGTSHVALSGPDQDVSQPLTGFLGADYEISGGHYRIKQIYKKDTWTPELRSPLTEPGVDVKDGDFILAVNGRELHATESIFELLQGTAGKPTVLKISADAAGRATHNITVIPLRSENELRTGAWEESNRRRVAELSGGRIGYIPVPDTRAAGYKSFNRYFFTQLDKQALVIDERFNRGGLAADYMTDVLAKPILNYWVTRAGHDFTTPVGANPGPKALLINMYAGSGGDALAWYFKHEKLGPVVGTRTWGGVSGTYDYPQFIDGGDFSTPQLAPYDQKGEWLIENQGVSPDIEIDVLPQDWRKGQDPQLEKTVEILLQQLKKGLPRPQRPSSFPDQASIGAQ